MKTRRQLRTEVSPKLRQKSVLLYAAVGIALAVLVGVGLFFYFNIGNSIDSFAKKSGAGYTSSGTGQWSDVNSWEKSAHWISDTPGDQVNVAYVDLYGYITQTGNLQLNGSTVLTVIDTLRITGDLYVTNGADIVIQSNGMLIVEGNYITDGGADMENGAVVIVMQDLIASGGADVINNDRFYLFGEPQSSGGASFNGKQNDPANSHFLGEDDLMQNSNLYAFATNTTTLPITLLSFEAHAQDDQVAIAWSTAEEIHNDFFTIERSKDGKSFQAISQVKGAGDSQNVLDYQYVDENPISGQSFYRLKQTDYDGQFEYFEIVSVFTEDKRSFLGEQQAIEVLKYGPNPFQYAFTTDFKLTKSGAAEVRLTDLNGSVVARQQVQAYEGPNTVSFEEGQSIKKGTYLMTIVQGDYQSKPVKLVKH